MTNEERDRIFVVEGRWSDTILERVQTTLFVDDIDVHTTYGRLRRLFEDLGMVK